MRFAIPREVAMQESDDWEGRPPFANRMKGMTASEIRELLKILDQPDVISLAGGIPDPALFPVAEIDSVQSPHTGRCGHGSIGTAIFSQRRFRAAAPVAGVAHGEPRSAL